MTRPFLLTFSLWMMGVSLLAETVILPHRVRAYSTRPGNPLAGYFPAHAELEVLSRTGQFVRVRFVSTSGRRIEALSTPRDLGLPPVAVHPQSEPSRTKWNPIDPEELDSRLLSPVGKKALADARFNWDHAQTEHFSIHFEHGMFARKVSRLAEFYYDYIADDLAGVQDLRPGRSHIYIFRKREGWAAFRDYGLGSDMQWAAAFVRGPEMYIQDFKNNKTAVNVLAHEMTHLVLNRFFRHPPPLWLNEGLAEWYGAFAYSAFKGTYKTRGSVFRNVRDVLPLSDLLQAASYPEGDGYISLYYLTSFYLVGFLRTEYPEESFMTFLHEMVNGKPVLPVLEAVYRITDFAAFEEDFRDFCGIR